MVFVVHPFGNTFVRALIASLEAERRLAMFYTSLNVDPNSKVISAAPAGLRRQLQRRTFAIPRSRVKTKPWPEVLRHTVPGRAQHEDAPYVVGRKVDRSAARWLAARGEAAHVTSVYAYEDFALSTFSAGAELNLPLYYDLPIAYWRVSNQLMEEESERYPEWAPTMHFRLSPTHYERKERELEMASAVFVPSQFVARSLEGFVPPDKPVHVIPFGSPTAPSESVDRIARNSGPLKVLFAGSMTQRKGLADVFAAIRLLNRSDIELNVLGSPMMPLDFYEQQGPFKHLSPRPHNEVLAAMSACDVFVLPSIVEGRALVQQEAMACGLPLIVTANAGGEDLVVEGKTGFLVPIRSPESIAERLAWCADNREAVEAMRPAAMEKSREYPWETYGADIARLLP